MLGQQVDFSLKDEDGLAIVRQLRIRKGGLIRPAENVFLEVRDLSRADFGFLKNIQGEFLAPGHVITHVRHDHPAGSVACQGLPVHVGRAFQIHPRPQALRRFHKSAVRMNGGNPRLGPRIGKRPK